MKEQKMAAPEVIIKCEEFMENDVHPAENDTYFNAYENHENDQENCPENGDNENDNDYEEDDDTKMQELLREFDLEILYTILKIGDITYRSLKYISENDINAAIRSIAYRAEFREKLFAWRRDKYGLNDYSVLPPSRNSVTPLGVNNTNNIQAFYTNNHNHNHNSNPPSNRAPSCNSMVSSMPNLKPQQKQPQEQIPPRRRLSNSKTNSAKRPRIHQNQEKSMNQVNNIQHPSQPPTPQQHQQPPPPLSPIQNSSRLSAQQQQYTQGDRSPTPPLTEPMTILHQDTSRLDAHQTMDYDDPLCYQATTSSAAAAAAGSANTPTLASLKQDDSSPYTTPTPKMSYEKLVANANCQLQMPTPPHHKKMQRLTNVDAGYIRQLLSKTPKGREILERYKYKHFLEETERASIVHFIIDYFICNDIKMDAKIMEMVANAIVTIFPNEDISVYYIPRGLRRLPAGKIYNRYLNRLYKQRPKIGNFEFDEWM